jgi:hypothetical protein
MGMKPRFRKRPTEEYNFDGINPPPSIAEMRPYKRIPCQECKGKGFINQHWAAGGGRIGYRSWMAICPSCRRRAGIMDGFEKTLELFKMTVAPEEYRFEIEGETWDPDKKRYFTEEKVDEQP